MGFTLSAKPSRIRIYVLLFVEMVALQIGFSQDLSWLTVFIDHHEAVRAGGRDLRTGSVDVKWHLVFNSQDWNPHSVGVHE